MRKFLLAFLLLFLTISNAQTTIYTNNMDYVIGDVKQAFIQNKITTQEQADYLLIGLKNLGVNGVRIPIFAEGHTPNKTMFDYFYNKLVEAGFPIFANPAQHAGGQRVACGILDAEDFCTVKDDSSRTATLIDRIQSFAYEYKCKWINPFNEDGSPGGAWSLAQINEIYTTLNGTLNDAELVGACAWGIPASIKVLNQSTIMDNITVATTHNLGYNHEDWAEFIRIAKTKNLPVWDSEVNHNVGESNNKGSRIEVAIASGVDGLVLYNIWGTIDLSNGSINNSGKTHMKMYLKNMPELTPNFSVNEESYQEGTSVIVENSDTVKFSPQPENGNWSWTGPNGFTSNDREITLADISNTKTGEYVASYTSSTGEVNHVVMSLGLYCEETNNITPYYRVNDVSWLVNTEITVNEGDKIQLGPQPTSSVFSWWWTGPNNFTSSARQITISSDIPESAAGEYMATYINKNTGCSKSISIQVNVNRADVPFPDPNARYYIDSPEQNVRLGADGENAFTTTRSTTGYQVEWTVIESTTPGYYYINCIGSVAKPRIRTQRNTVPQMTGSGSTGGQTKWLLTPSTNSTFFLDTALDNTSYPRLQINNNKEPSMTVDYIVDGSVKFIFTDTRKGFVGSDEDAILSTDNNLIVRSELFFPGYLNASKDVFKPINTNITLSDYQLNVYNIQGQQVFSSNRVENGWKPNTSNKGIYVFVVKYTNTDNKLVLKNGKVLVN